MEFGENNFMLLVHVCCAPCLTFPLLWLREHNPQIQGFFFNPNIHPAGEYRQRLNALEDYAQRESLPIVFDRTYGLVDFVRNVAGKEPERCVFCYRWRLTETARQAKRTNCEAFTTTLLVSPYQKHDLIRSIGESVAKEEGVEFFYQDWRDGYRQGQRIAREAGIYRQRYCGCIYSEAEREDML